ncbi:tRNA (guanine-N7-)-methyltransferase [Nematocida minor]|uniref:tRNA (guanine-N7-)-methyltransferase n=1 Tax=Nematocida minor TaxID=1912983 RepID=UPI00221E5585|nr:tRNA (guanine-N7-)-methyltransferase [Nematocida minor]KAI5189714.1 tRNA (guanine-N7-)-methyltransferase [Nematocida minor]
MNSAVKPQKRNHRQRAHSNPFSDHNISYPLNPSFFDTPVDMVDIGCGYGGLLFKLSELYSNDHILGMEIREKLVDYVDLKIKFEQETMNKSTNVSVVRANSMKFLTNYIEKESLKKMFILFPDPHFKKKKHKARIVSKSMLDIYQYVIKPDGRLYISTDVEELFSYMCQCIEEHPLFSRLTEEEAQKDILYEVIIETTEESKKADIKHSNKYRAIFKRLP